MSKMKKAKGILIVVFALILTCCILAACANNDNPTNDDGNKVAVKSVTISNAQTTLAVGEYELFAKVLPQTAPQTVSFALATAVEGVQIDGNILTVTPSVKDGATVTVTATSTADTTKKASKTFALTNRGEKFATTVVGNVTYRVIATRQDLLTLAMSEETDDFSKNYLMTADIDMVASSYNAPIGSLAGAKGVAFTGIFDGNGYKIDGLWSMMKNADSMALFYTVGVGAVVKNLQIAIATSSDIRNFTGSLQGKSQVALVAVNNYGIIENVYAQGVVESKDANSVAGLVYNNSGVLRYCISDLSLVAASSPYNNSGFASVNTGDIYGCFINGDTSYTTAVLASPSALDAQCIKSGAELKSAKLYQGFDNTVWLIKNGSFPTIKNNCTTNPVVDDDYGDCYINITTEPQILSFRVSTSLQLQWNTVPADSAVVFSVKDNPAGVSVSQDGLITFTSQAQNGGQFTVVVQSADDDKVTAEYTFQIFNYRGAPVQISGGADFKALCDSADPMAMFKDYVLTANINMSGNKIMKPMGYVENTNGTYGGTPFMGIFDGNGYTISGNRIGGGEPSTAIKGNMALFYQIAQGAVVRNLGVDFGANNYIVGQNEVSLFTHDNYGTIENCIVYGGKIFYYREGAAQTEPSMGGFVYHNYGAIKNCLNLTYNQLGNTNPYQYAALCYDNVNEGRIEGSFVYANAFSADAPVLGVLATASAYDAVCIKSQDQLYSATTYLNSGWSRTVWTIRNGQYPALRPNCATNPSEDTETIAPFVQYDGPTDVPTVIDVLTQDTYTMSFAVKYPAGATAYCALKQDVQGIVVDTNGAIHFNNTGSIQDRTSFTVEIYVDGVVCLEIDFVLLNNNTIQWVEISTLQQFKAFFETQDPADLNKCYMLTNNLDVGTSAYKITKPIGWATQTPFTGIFDGNGYTLQHLYAGASGTENMGLFYKIAACGVVRNLAIDMTKGTNSNGYIVGYPEVSLFTHDNYGTIENCIVSGGKVYLYPTAGEMGALVFNNYGTIKNCLNLNYNHVSGSSTYPYSGLVNNCGKDEQGNDIGQIVNCFAYDMAATDSPLNTSGNTYGPLERVMSQASSYDALCIKTKTQLQTASTYEGWNTNVWNIVNGQYPSLINGCSKNQ